MTNFVDPKLFDLPPHTKIEEINSNTLAIVINRKSRIIMADGRKILAKAAKIKQSKPSSKVLLKTSAPVCTRTGNMPHTGLKMRMKTANIDHV